MFFIMINLIWISVKFNLPVSNPTLTITIFIINLCFNNVQEEMFSKLNKHLPDGNKVLLNY